MNAIAAIAAYQDVNLDTEVLNADPHKLVAMLYDGALVAIHRAKGEMQRKDREGQGKSISKAVAILGDGLLASIDHEQGGDIAANLSWLYDYMIKRLVTANATNDPALLDEVARLLGELQEAWTAIRPQALAAVAKRAAADLRG